MFVMTVVLTLVTTMVTMVISEEIANVWNKIFMLEENRHTLCTQKDASNLVI